MAKFCPECANPIIDANMQFCTKCGAKIPTISGPCFPVKEIHRLPHDILPKKPPTYEEAPTWTTSDLGPPSEPPVEPPIEPPTDTTQPTPTPTPPRQFTGAQVGTGTKIFVIILIVTITVALSLVITPFVFTRSNSGTVSSGCPAGYSTAINDYKCCPTGSPYDYNGKCYQQPQNTQGSQTQSQGSLPSGFPTNLPTGTYSLTTRTCVPGGCTETYYGTITNTNGYEISNALTTILNPAVSACNSQGGSCSVRYSAFNGNSFTATLTATTCSGASCVTVTSDYIISKV